VLVGVPWGRVCLGSLVGELFLLHATTAVVAVSGAHRTLASLPVVAIEALAFASLAVAGTFVRALHTLVGVIVADSGVNPGLGLGACTFGAVVLRPGGIRVLWARVARALVVFAARSVAGAAVGAVSRDGYKADEQECSTHVWWQL